MKRVVSVVVLVAFIINCAPRQFQTSRGQYEKEYLISISERVGEMIDAEEREQYGLFQGIEEYKSAQFYAIKGGGYAVEIVTETQRLVSLNNDPDAINVLLGYIGNYTGKASDRVSFEATRNIVDYDTLGLPIVKSQVDRVGRGRATTCGCVGGLTVVLACVLVISATYNEEADPGWNALGILLAIPMVAVLALVTGCLSGTASFFGEKKTAVDKIKEQRKLIVIE